MVEPIEMLCKQNLPIGTLCISYRNFGSRKGHKLSQKCGSDGTEGNFPS
jgi:hypothetical protein